MIIYDRNKCNMCRDCVAQCKFNALEVLPDSIKITDSCVNCGNCVKTCKTGALELIIKKNTNPITDYKNILVFDPSSP